MNEGVIEVNAGPGLRMHMHPLIGKPIDVGSHIIEYLFNNQSNGHIPIISVTGVNGKTTTVNLISYIVMQKYYTGKITSMGMYFNSNMFDKGDCSGYHSTKKILANPKTEFAVLEIARGGILKRGIGYNYADVAILTNIRNGDHIGKNFDNFTIDDLIDVKMVVLKNIKKNGWVVLNANDIHTNKIINKLNEFEITNIILFSISKNDKLISEYILSNKPVLYYDEIQNNIIYIFDNTTKYFECSKYQILEDKIQFQIENVLACIGACLAYGFDIEFINGGLIKYRNDINTNPSRMNKIKYGNSIIIFDYAHNIDSILGLKSFIINNNFNKKIISIAPTGDRDDDVLIKSFNILCETFDYVLFYISEINLRGKTVEYMYNLIFNNVYPNDLKNKIIFIKDEVDAYNKALTILDKNNNDIFIHTTDLDNDSINNLIKKNT